MKLFNRITEKLSLALAPAKQQLFNSMQPLASRFGTLQPREQLLVSIGSIMAALAVAYLLVWTPLANFRSTQENKVMQARVLAQRLETLQAKLVSSNGSALGAEGRDQSLLTIIDQAGHDPQLAKQPARMQPEGEKIVKVWFEDVSFDALTQWIFMLQDRYGITASSAEFEKHGAAGAVSVRLTLVR